MADTLGVSTRTIERRLHASGLSIRDSYSTMSDSDLDREISSIRREHSDAGYRMMFRLLFAKGCRVQQHRIRESMARCDPQGVCLRWIRAAHRRRAYSVLGPQALWHIDGHHKLIKYVLVRCLYSTVELIGVV